MKILKSLKHVVLVVAAGVVFFGAGNTVNAEGNVAINETNFPDSVFRNYVKEEFDTNKDGYLDKAEIQSVQMIDVPKMNISSLKGVEYFSSVGRLFCEDNNIESLDVSSLFGLYMLDCYNNRLTSLDVSSNHFLESLTQLM